MQTTDLIGSIDANVLLRLIVGDVPDQLRDAEALLARGPVEIDDVAVVEVIFVLGREYRLDRRRQTAAILTALALPTVRANAAVLEAALATYLEQPKLSFEDCYLVARSERSSHPLWTFDRKLAAQTSAELVPPAARPEQLD